MKKVTAVILVSVMAVLFASCGKDDEAETTTLIPIPDTAVAISSQSVSEQITTEPQQETGATMILTTNYGETMPTVVTTQFDPSKETTQATVPVSFEIPVMTAPTVYTSAMPTTAKPTTTTLPTEHTEPTEPKNDGNSDSTGKTRKALELSSFALSPDNKNVVIEFDVNGWNGGVKSGKFSASVKTDTGKTGTVVGRVVGIKSADGNFSVYVPVEDMIDDDVSSLNVTIPAGAVASVKGDQTSKAFPATINVN